MWAISRGLMVWILLSASSIVSAQTINYYVISKQAQPFQIEDKAEKHSGIVTDVVKAGRPHEQIKVTF